MSQLLDPTMGEAIAVWGRAVLLLAVGVVLLALLLSYIDARFEEQEQAGFALVDRRAANEAECEMANELALCDIPADPSCSPAPWTVKGEAA